jgi:hypothetical protein
MSNAYDAGKYGVITRTYFGLTDKLGGGFTSPYTKGSATTVVKLKRFYPRGPIKILKVGLQVLATLGTPATAPPDGFYYRLSKGGGVIATDFVTAQTTGRVALYGIASKPITATDGVIAAGDYISIKTSTPYTMDATVEAGTINGSFAFFIDWVPYKSSDWNEDPRISA